MVINHTHLPLQQEQNYCIIHFFFSWPLLDSWSIHVTLHLQNMCKGLPACRTILYAIAHVHMCTQGDVHTMLWAFFFCRTRGYIQADGNMCMFVCLYACLCKSIYMCVCVCMNVCMEACVCVHAYIYLYVCVCVCMYAHIHAYVCACTHKHRCMHA